MDRPVAIDADRDQAWFVAQRWQQYAGEQRANLLRMAAVAAFYLLHLGNYLGGQGKLPQGGLLQLSSGEPVSPAFHLQATLLALAWAMAAAGIHLALAYRLFPRWISHVTSGVDLVLLTAILCIANGPRSPLVVGYFLIVALAGLRFSLTLVRTTTVGAMVGYLCVLGMAKWPGQFGRPAKLDLRVPRFEQLILLAALALCGVFVGQIVRQVRPLAQEYRRRLTAEETP